MKPLIMLSAITCLLQAVPAHSSPKELPHSWPKESNLLGGVDIQGNILEQLPPCPADSGAPKELCRINASLTDHFEILGLPSLPLTPGYRVEVLAPKGEIKKLFLIGSTNELRLVTDMLSADFGQPGSRETVREKLYSGGSYSVEVLKWEGERLVARFQPLESDPGRYSVGITLSGADVFGAMDSTGQGSNVAKQ